MAAGISDEVFGLSMAVKGRFKPFYTYGIMSMAMPGWALGTLLGIVSGNILPERLISALSIALYGMLLAVIIPPAKGNKVLTGLILISMSISLLFAKLPYLNMISSGVKIILLTIVIAGVAAVLFPVKEEIPHEANVFLYIIVMAVVTYFVRVLPLTSIRKEIKNTFIKSFLYYVPYVTLSVMVFPAILEATSSPWSALVGFIVAILLAYFGGSLFKVSLLACLAVFVMELFV